jgi:uncharacterized protein YkwD
MPFRRHLVLAAALSTLGALMISATVAPLRAEADGNRSTVLEAQTMVVLTNRLRTSLGTGNLAVRDDLVAVACGWAEQLVQTGEVQHSPYIADATLLSQQIGHDWALAGENVGSGPDVYAIQGALAGSPAHYKNLVDPEFTHIGICVRHDSRGTLFIVEEFLTVKPQKSRRPKR